MNKACIFDFDGVMIDNEKYWEREKLTIFSEIYGADIASKLDKTLGANMDAIHARAVSLGSNVSVEKMYEAGDRHAKIVYTQSPITEGLDELLTKLDGMGIVMGVVSASPKWWIDLTLARIPHADVLKIIISLHDRADLAHKPAPDGYREAMKVLGSTPETTMVIEDSNVGIVSAKAAGAYTIGLRQNNVDGYAMDGADTYVDTISQVAQIALSFGNIKN